MGTQKLLSSTMLAALAVATIGAGKFPPPHRYTGIFALWFLLGIVSQFGAGAARFCGALSGLVVLAMAMGTGGQRLLAWVNGLGPRLGTGPPPATAPAGGGPAARGAGMVGSIAANSPRPRSRPRQKG